MRTMSGGRSRLGTRNYSLDLDAITVAPPSPPSSPPPPPLPPLPPSPPSPSSTATSDVDCCCPPEGIVCTDSELDTLLKKKKKSVATPPKPPPPQPPPPPPQGKVATAKQLVRKRLVGGKDFLAQEAMGGKMNRKELFSQRCRRVSTGSISLAPPPPSSLFASNPKRAPPPPPASNRVELVSWDSDRDLRVDPQLIGKVIEDRLKGKEEEEEGKGKEEEEERVEAEEKKSKKEEGWIRRRFLLRHGRRKSSLTDIGEIAPRRQPQRALSVDLGDTGMPPQPHMQVRPEWAVAHQVDGHPATRPRKLSLQQSTATAAVAAATAATAAVTTSMRLRTMAAGRRISEEEQDRAPADVEDAMAEMAL